MAAPKFCLPEAARELILEVLGERVAASAPEDKAIINEVMRELEKATDCQKVRGKRGPNPYNEFVGKCIKERGLSMTECAAQWKAAKTGGG